ncbi:amidohydrolase [Mycoplasmoides alvi]|uniref:amidohydrolase n=1 Tax=Mycoplasmoides alvi TaxID=78580 RepID=UPI000696D2D7|nr:amidohydrolase [Mycoplasmoides alvi]
MNTILSTKILKNKLITLYVAKKIITVNDRNDEAEAVLVQEDKIIGYGKTNELKKLLNKKHLNYIVNNLFKNKYIYPGFIEPHMHPQLLGMYLLNFPYIGFFDRKLPNGKILKGLKTLKEVIEFIKKEINKDANKNSKWINFWGYDPLFHNKEFLTKDVLDSINQDIPICILHQSNHVMSLNTAGLQKAGYTNLSKDDPLFDSNNLQKINGELTGIVSETEGMKLAIISGAMNFKASLDDFINATKLVSKIAQLNGVTTIADKGLGFPSLNPELSYQAYVKYSLNEESFTRFHLDIWFASIIVYGGWNKIEKMIKNNNKYLWIGGQKIILDGSIQGFTANLIPGQVYVDNILVNGNLQLNENELATFIENAEIHNLPSHIHANGSGAIEACIKVIEKIHPYNSNKFRHTIEHNQLVTNNQLSRMSKNNICSNFFINHIYYYGDIHAKYTVGPNLVHGMNPTKSGLMKNVIFAFHSDDPVTPVNPLLSIWTAVNRQSLTSSIYGEDEIISVYDALKAITINAAYLLNQENYIGSIDLHKFADFTVLDSPLTEIDKENIKNINIYATVLGGKVYLTN